MVRAAVVRQARMVRRVASPCPSQCSNVGYVRAWPPLRIAIATAAVGSLSAVGACSLANEDADELSVSTQVRSTEQCSDVLVPRGGDGVSEVSVGYSDARYGFGDEAEFRLCLIGMSGITLSVAAPDGVEVTPVTASTGALSVAVLRFTVRVHASAVSRPLQLQIGRKGVDPAGVTPPPELGIETSPEGWRFVQVPRPR